MKDELDRILSSEGDLTPSSGFVKNVMDAVRAEALAPQPLPFPWRRALPGLVLCALFVSAACVAAILRPGPQRAPEPSTPSLWTHWSFDPEPWLHALNAGGLGWIILALLLTLISVKLSLRLVSKNL